MKNLFYLFFTALLLAGFVSCSDDDDNSIKFYVAESYNAEGTPNLVLAESLSANIGSGRDIYIKGGNGTYTVTSDNDNIAVVEPYAEVSNTFFISTKKELGSTTIRVKDGNNIQTSITISVNRYKIQYSVAEAYTYLELKEGTTLDENMKKEIEDEIAERVIPVGNALTLTYDKPGSGDLSITKSGTSVYTGTFIETKNEEKSWFNIDAKYNNKEFHYLVTRLENLIKKSTGPVYLDLVEDMTDVYKEKYPDANLTKVYAVMNVLYTYNPQ